MNDNQFWELVDSYEAGHITVKDAIEEICANTNKYEVAMADLELLVKRTIKKEEKLLVKECLDDKKLKRGIRTSKKEGK